MEFIIGVLTVLSVVYGICEFVQFVKDKYNEKKDGDNQC